MASGNLGLISFPREPGRVTLEQIEEHHPRLVPALRDHPGIGFVLVRSERPRRAGASARRDASTSTTDRVEGEDPLAPFGPNAADHLRRTDGFPHCPDIMVNSTYWAELEEVAAFEELVGSHGGHGRRRRASRSCCTRRSCRGRRSRSSGPSGSTASCAAGSPALGQTPTRVEASDSPGVEHAHLDVGRELGHLTRELARRVVEQLPRAAARGRWGRTCPSGSAPRSAARAARPPRAARARVQVARAERRPPAPDRHQRDVDSAASSPISVEQVGVAGEVDAALPANSKPIGWAVGPRQRQRRADGGPRRPHSISPDLRRLARGQLDDAPKPRPVEATRRRPGGRSAAPRGRPAQRGQSRWSRCRWEISTASIRSAAWAPARRRGDAGAGPGRAGPGLSAAGSPSSSTKTVECPTNVRRSFVNASPRLGDAQSPRPGS